MQLLPTLLTLSLTLTSLAEPIPAKKRALSDYEGVFDNISAQVDVVSTAVAAYTAGTQPGSTVQDASDDLVDVINTGATSVAGFDALSSLDALALVSPIQDLTSDVGDLVDAIIDAESEFEADGLAGDVLTALQAQKTAAEGLKDAITPKVPSALQGIAGDLANGIVTEIERGITAYSD
ncbi:hydrophobic surface binding protein A-domain-containing protein [Aspergillus unguis]